MEVRKVALTIRRVDSLYKAEVSPPESEVAWVSPKPMKEKALWEKLIELGCHPRDVADAFEDADRGHPGLPFSRRNP